MLLKFILSSKYEHFNQLVGLPKRLARVSSVDFPLMPLFNETVIVPAKSSTNLQNQIVPYLARSPWKPVGPGVAAVQSCRRTSKG